MAGALPASMFKRAGVLVLAGALVVGALAVVELLGWAVSLTAVGPLWVLLLCSTMAVAPAPSAMTTAAIIGTARARIDSFDQILVISITPERPAVGDRVVRFRLGE